jgi:protoporphyrinogen oxidase
MAATRIPPSSGIDVLLRVLKLRKESKYTNADYFYYPKKGFGQIVEKIVEQFQHLGGRLILGADNVRFRYSGNNLTNVIWQSNGISFEEDFDILISAIPLSYLVNNIEGFDNDRLKKLVGDLPFRHLVLVYLAFEKERCLNEHWIFVPDPEIIFNRIYEPKVLSEELSPENKTIICCDLTMDENQWTHTEEEELVFQCGEGLKKMDIIHDEPIEYYRVICVKDFYPCYGLNYREQLNCIFKELAHFKNLICTGRLGLINYNNFDHCLYLAMQIAGEYQRNTQPSEITTKLIEKTLNFKIID